MPRSDGGRAAARRWSEGCTENRHSSVSYRGRAFAGTKRSIGGFRKDRSHHPRRWLCHRLPLLSRGGAPLKRLETMTNRLHNVPQLKERQVAGPALSFMTAPGKAIQLG